MDLFVYGTLMDDELVAELTGQLFHREPAALHGYRKLVSALGYSYLIPDADGTVDGFLLRDVSPAALRAFDRYEDEGRLYRRTELQVEVGGHPQRAMTYVGIPEALTRSGSAD